MAKLEYLKDLVCLEIFFESGVFSFYLGDFRVHNIFIFSLVVIFGMIVYFEELVIFWLSHNMVGLAMEVGDKQQLGTIVRLCGRKISEVLIIVGLRLDSALSQVG